MCAPGRACLPRGRATSPDSCGPPRYPGSPEPDPAPVLDPPPGPKARGQCCLFLAPRPEVVVPAKRGQQGINSSRDKGSCWDVRRARRPLWRAPGAAPDAAGRARVGVIPPPWARGTESRLGHPAPGTSWPASWETWSKERKAPSLRRGCGHHCVATVPLPDRTSSLPSV